MDEKAVTGVGAVDGREGVEAGSVETSSSSWTQKPKLRRLTEQQREV